MKEWTPEEEAARLAERFVGVGQAKFAREHKVPGGASMVSQHIKGHRPIAMAAAVAYARGFGVPLSEISPRLAAQVAAAASAIQKPAAEPGEPPKPGPKFQDRHEVTASDWATLQAVKNVLSDAELADIRQRSDEIEARVTARLSIAAERAKREEP